jgi:hypothetical protein
MASGMNPKNEKWNQIPKTLKKIQITWHSQMKWKI